MKKSATLTFALICLALIIAGYFFFRTNGTAVQNNSAAATTAQALIGGWRTVTGGFGEEIDFGPENVFSYYSGGDGVMRLVEECSWTYADTVLKIDCPNSGMQYSYDTVSASDTTLSLTSSVKGSDSGTYERIKEGKS